MKNIHLEAVSITEQSIDEATDSLNCTFDTEWRHILIQGEEIEVTGGAWVQVEMSSEFSRGVSLQEYLALDEENGVFTLTGYTYPDMHLYETVAGVMKIVARQMLDVGSRVGKFLTIFPVEDRRHFRLHHGVVQPFDTLQCADEICRVQTFVHDSDNRLLVGTNKGLLIQEDPDGPFESQFLIPGIRWLLTDPGGNIFLGTENNGVFRTENNGSSWQKAGNLPVEKVESFAFDDENQTMYLNTAFGIFVSYDDGKSWTTMPEKYFFGGVKYFLFDIRNRILIAKTRDNKLYLREV